MGVQRPYLVLSQFVEIRAEISSPCNKLEVRWKTREEFSITLGPFLLNMTELTVGYVAGLIALGTFIGELGAVKKQSSSRNSKQPG